MKRRTVGAILTLALCAAAAPVALEACSRCAPEPPPSAPDVRMGVGPAGLGVPPYTVPVVEGIEGNGQSLLLGNSTVPITTQIPMSVMLFDSKGLYWNPNTTYAAGMYVWPNDPLDAGASFHNSDGGLCTSGNTVEPNWNRTNGTTTSDGTCVWLASTADAAIPYDWTNPDSSSLAIVNLSEPERPINTGIGGSAYSHGAYPNNVLGEMPSAGMCAVYAPAMGVICASHVTGRANATYAELKAGGSGNAYDAGIFEVTAYPRLVTAKFGAGYTYRVAALNWDQGEANCGDSPSTTSANIAALQSAFEAQATAVTGQSTSIPLILTQTNSCTNPAAVDLPVSAASALVPQGQLDASNLNQGKVIFAAPKYEMEMAGDGAHQSPAGSYNRTGEKEGQALSIFKRTGSWTGLQPTQIVVAANDAGGAAVTITLPPYAGSLQFDPNMPLYHQSGTFSDAGQGGAGHGWTNSHGFEVYSAAGAVQGIVSAVINGSNQVVLTTLGSDVGFVGYAAMADASAPCTGCSIRGGQLADHDPFVGPDLDTFTCTLTNGSARVSGCPAGKIDNARTLYDFVTGSGFAAGTVAVNRSGGVGTMDLSHVWTGSSGPASLTWFHNMWNYGASFLVRVANTSGIAAFEFSANTAGGTSRATCTGCLNGVRFWIANPGSPAGTTIAQLGATILSGGGAPVDLTGIPSLSAGSYDLQVQNPYNQIEVHSNAITATASDTFLSIAGTRAVVLLTGASVVQASNLVSQVNDLSNRGNAFLDGAVVSHQVTYTASSANANGQPTWTCDGSGYLKIGTFNFAASAGNALYWMGVGKITAPGTTSVAMQYNPTVYEWQVLATGVNRWGAPTATWGSSSTGAMKFLDMGRPAGLAGTTHSAFFAVSNGTDVTASGSYASSVPTSAAAAICARNNGTLPVASEWAAVMVWNSQPSSAERTRLYNVAKGLFGSGI